MAKEIIGAYAEPELIQRIMRECKIAVPGMTLAKSQMMVLLMTEALDARDAKRGKKKA